MSGAGGPVVLVVVTVTTEANIRIRADTSSSGDLLLVFRLQLSCPVESKRRSNAVLNQFGRK